MYAVNVCECVFLVCVCGRVVRERTLEGLSLTGGRSSHEKREEKSCTTSSRPQLQSSMIKHEIDYDN